MLVIAHRGALHEAQENSREAFRKAVDAGATRIELDAQMTADGEVVVMHDDNLFRSTGVSRHISQCSAAEIKKMTLHNGEPVPFLRDVIEEFVQQIEFNIEIKGSSQILAAKVEDIVARINRDDRFVISCFRPEPLLYFRQHRPEMRRACLIGDSPRWPYLAEQQPLIFMQMAATNIIHPWAPLVDANFMDQAKARQWQVYPYCSAVGEEDSDREGLWTQLQTLGIDGLCTNYPRELNAWLAENKRHEYLIKNA